MIKGLLAFFTSGILLKPMALLGILFAVLLYAGANGEQIFTLFCNFRSYILLFIIAGLYTCVCDRIYHTGARTIDWKATFFNIFNHFFILLLSICFGLLLLMLIFF